MAVAERRIRTDEEIKTAIVEELSWDTRVNAASVQVVVDGGMVTLKGTVPSSGNREAAEEDALGIPGVVGVDNQLTVELSKPEHVPSDSTIRDTIITALEFNPDIDSTNIEPQVDAGTVTLTGTVPTHWEKNESAILSGMVKGVVKVTNELAVVPTEKVDDALIAIDVEHALARSALIDPGEVDVTVSDGTVTLQGNVHSTRARLAAYRAAERTRGVVEVRNQLMVRP